VTVGDPVRFAFVGSTGSTSKALQFFNYDGVPYVIGPQDYFIFVSLNISATSAVEAVILNDMAGASTVFTSTLLLSFGASDTTTAIWHDEATQAMASSPGLTPSVLCVADSSTIPLYVSGTGFVQHLPGFSRPWNLNT